jgi:hypothetical protein
MVKEVLPQPSIHIPRNRPKDVATKDPIKIVIKALAEWHLEQQLMI